MVIVFSYKYTLEQDFKNNPVYKAKNKPSPFIGCRNFKYIKVSVRANQLLGAPLSIQQRIEFFCAFVIEPVNGISPLATADRMMARALNIVV